MQKQIPRILVIAFCLISASAIWATDDRADERGILVLDRAVVIPGYYFTGDESGQETLIDMELAAGTYALEVVNPASMGVTPASWRVLVRVTSLDRNFSVTLMGLPDFDVPRGSGATFYTAETGELLALRSWFDPSARFGIKFVYPEVQAVEIARESRDYVIAAVVPVVNTGATEEPPMKELLLAPLKGVGPDGRAFELFVNET
jgi:hypothetical protein